MPWIIPIVTPKLLFFTSAFYRNPLKKGRAGDNQAACPSEKLSLQQQTCYFINTIFFAVTKLPACIR